MTEPLTVKSTNPLLSWATAAGVVGLAAGGFTLSFAALRDLATRSGIDPQLAFLWPLIVDGFIVVATAAAFALKRRGRRVTWYPWTALIFFSAISVVGNSIHATDAHGLRVPIPVATIVSSVPAVALLIASHLLVVMIEGRTEKQPSRAQRKQLVRGTTAAVSIPTPIEPMTAVAPELVMSTQSGETNASTDDVAEEAVLERLRGHLEAGRQITGAVIAGELGVSERTGRRRLEQFRTKFPDLFEVEAAQ